TTTHASAKDHVSKRFAPPPAMLRLNRKITLQNIFFGGYAEQFDGLSDNLFLALKLDERAERRFIEHDVQFGSVGQCGPVNSPVFLVPKPFAISEALEDRHGALRVFNRGFDLDPFLEPRRGRQAVRFFFVSDSASAGGGTHAQDRGALPEMIIGRIEQPVVFKMARGFNLQGDSGPRERVKAVESELHFNFVLRCHRDHIHSCTFAAEILCQATCPAWYSGLSSNVPGATLRKRL